MYQCSSCGKRYSRKYCLTRHQTTACRRRKDTGKEQEQFAQETTERPPVEKEQHTQNVQLSLSDSESDSDSIPDNPEEVKALFRQLYKKLHHNIERFSKLILLLDELLHMGYLTKEEYNEMNNNLQKKIGML